MFSGGYKIRDENAVYFLTFAVVEWVDTFTRRDYSDIAVKSLNYCVENKGLLLHAWVILPNHVQQMILKIKNHQIPCRKTIDENGVLTVNETIYVVCHSMGFAYAMVMVDELSKYMTIGRIYVLAPEGACTGSIPKTFEEFWQYGSNEASVNEGGDPVELQDGVAPHCRINGLQDVQGKSGRVYIPALWSPKDFLNSHYAVNYTRIFDRSPNQLGYVKPR